MTGAEIDVGRLMHKLEPFFTLFALKSGGDHLLGVVVNVPVMKTPQDSVFQSEDAPHAAVSWNHSYGAGTWGSLASSQASTVGSSEYLTPVTVLYLLSTLSMWARYSFCASGMV